MPERPSYVAQEQISAPGFGRSLPMPKPDTSGEMMGEGIARAGESLQRAAGILREAELKKRTLAAAADSDAQFVQQAAAADAAVQSLKIGASYQDYSQKVLKTLDEFGNAGLKSLKDPLAQAEFKKRFNEFHLTRYNEALKFGNQLFHQHIEGALANRFSWSMHEAAKLGPNAGGFDVVGQAVQDAYGYAALAPELEATIVKATNTFIKDAVGRMMRQDAAEQPFEFAKTGAQRWADRNLTFTDSAGRPHNVVIGPDPKLVVDLEHSAARRAEVIMNHRHAIKTQMDKEMTDTVKRQAESDLIERYDLLLAHPELNWRREDTAKFAKYAHHDYLGPEAVRKLKEDVIHGAIGGLSVPGSAEDAMYKVVIGQWGVNEIMGTDLGKGDKVKALHEWARLQKEDDVSHLPEYKVNEKLVLTAVGQRFPLAGFSLDPHPKAQEAVVAYREAMRRPGVTIGDAHRIAEEIIKIWHPGYRFGPKGSAGGPAAPKKEEGQKPKRSGVEPERFDKAPEVNLPKYGDRE